MRKIMLAAALLAVAPLAYAAHLPGGHKNVGLFCTHYSDYVVQALDARNNEMTPQQAYQSIRGGSTQHYFSRQQAKMIINIVYFKMPDIPVQSTQASVAVDNQVWDECVREFSHPAYHPLTRNQNLMAVQPQETAPAPRINQPEAKTPVSPALPYSDSSPIPPAKPTDHPKASL